MPTPRKYENAAQRQAAYRRRCQERAGAMLGGAPVPGLLGRRRWRALCAQAYELVAQVNHEMEAYYEQRSAVWQDSARGETFSELMESIAEIATALTEVRAL